MNVRVAVADDEALGRRGVLARLAGRDGVEVVAECATGEEALEAVRRLAPDVLFLDVRMPGLDGLAVAQALPPEERPHVVFVTAFDRHALEAFRVHALDYLLKPIDDDRFEEAWRRAVEAVRGGRQAELGRRVAAFLGGGAPARAEILPVRLKGRTLFVKHAEIDRVEAEGDYVRVVSGARAWRVRDTMSAVERSLGPRRFLRIHRGTIVNLDRVVEVRDAEGEAFVVLADGAALPVGRSYRAALRRLGALG